MHYKTINEGKLDEHIFSCLQSTGQGIFILIKMINHYFYGLLTTI